MPVIEKIKKRSGEVVEFNQSKIEIAIQKAFVATNKPFAAEVVAAIADSVVKELEINFVDKIPGVEDIQDIVEKKLIEQGFIEVARAYIIYRAEHKKIREQEQRKILKKIEKSDLRVIKRDGSSADFDIKQIEKAIKIACREYRNEIDILGIIEGAKLNIYDGIRTKEINQAVLMSIKNFLEKDPIYSTFAARFLFNDIYKEVFGFDESDKNFTKKYRARFAKQLKDSVKLGRLDPALLKFDLKKISQAIQPERDRLFAYLGAQVIADTYLLRDPKQNRIEVPQYFWMRIAMGLALNEKGQREKWAIEFYNVISQMLYIPSTPTLFASGTIHPQMSSCYLTTVEDDLFHIFKCIGDNAQLSKWCGGVANDWSSLRGTGALIKKTNVHSQGVIPFLKIVDSTTAAINRSGKRRGATCVYLETWHWDIEDFLDLRKNTGDERRRTHDINTANWIPDLFMKRVVNDEEWTLFSADETPDLHHTYGKEFETRYLEYEKRAATGQMTLWKKVRAQDLWRKMITMLYETGHPWITFKDPCNIRSPQDHVGTVHCSNLCTEITLNTSAEETAVCNLGSINLARHVTKTGIDKELLMSTVHLAMRMLDNVIDLNFYPIKEAETSNLRHRPVGLGIMGTQDVLYELGMCFEEDRAVGFSDEIMEFVSYNAILASTNLAKERGTYPSFKGSKWNRDILPIDTVKLLEQERGLAIETDLTAQLDWTPIREAIKKYGMRNSNCLAIAPTATIANIAGCIPSIEPIYKNIYVKSNQFGEFTVINSYLISDLKKLGIWNSEMIEKIKYYDGNIQKIEEIPLPIRNKYKEVFEIDPRWLIKHAAQRGKWIDQSQSLNIFTNSTSGRLIADIYVYAWQVGLKTTYYLRSLGASAIEKSTIDINKKYELTLVKNNEPTNIKIFEGGICDSCQ